MELIVQLNLKLVDLFNGLQTFAIQMPHHKMSSHFEQKYLKNSHHIILSPKVTGNLN
jgi:hypothetical protein